MAASGQRRAAVEDADVIEPEETAFKEVVAKAVLPVHPPTEVQHQLGKGALKEINVPLSRSTLFSPVQENGGPGMHRRIHVAEVPFIRRDLTGRVQEELLQHQVQ